MARIPAFPRRLAGGFCKEAHADRAADTPGRNRDTPVFARCSTAGIWGRPSALRRLPITLRATSTAAGRQQRLAVKVFDAYSTKKPFEFMTSRCVTLYDHTSAKSDDELFLHALTTLANGGAYFFIDAINPDGTLEESFYRRLQALNGKLAPFRT